MMDDSTGKINTEAMKKASLDINENIIITCSGKQLRDELKASDRTTG